MAEKHHLFRRVLTLPIRFYQKVISPSLPPACLYYPSCSEYMARSIQHFGAFRGFLSGILRLLRCNGWFFKGGQDDVPEHFSVKFLLSRYRKFYRYQKPKQSGK